MITVTSGVNVEQLQRTCDGAAFAALPILAMDDAIRLSVGGQSDEQLVLDRGVVVEGEHWVTPETDSVGAGALRMAAV
jgi:hypothetical protein